MHRPDEILSISSVNERIKTAIDSAFPEPIWVKGELTGYDRGKLGRHIYFELAEKDPARPQAKSKIRAVIWAGKKPTIERRLKSAGRGMELQDGIEVKLLCRVDLYVPYGSYQLVVEDIDPAYTLGKLAMDREAILMKLEEMELLDRNKRADMPDVPLRVGLITRAESAAYNDFMNELFNSGIAFRTTILNCAMQGQEVERAVTGAIRELNRRDNIDVIVICRGGGSRTDLAWFDNLAIGVEIGQSRLPVITGIGHEIDQSVADIVAHTEVKTPTAAAQFLIERVAGWLSRLEVTFEEILRRSRDIVADERARLPSLAGELSKMAARRVAFESSRQRQGLGRLQVMVKNRTGRERDRFDGLCEGLSKSAGRNLRAESGKRRERTDLLKKLSEARLRRASERLKHDEEKCGLADPDRILRRGFTWTQDEKGRIIKSAADAKPGRRIVTRFRDGEVVSRVEEDGGQQSLNID